MGRVLLYPVATDNHGNRGELLGCPSHLLDCTGAEAWPGLRVHHVDQWEVGGALSQGTLLPALGRDRGAPVPRFSRMPGPATLLIVKAKVQDSCNQRPEVLSRFFASIMPVGPLKERETGAEAESCLLVDLGSPCS